MKNLIKLFTVAILAVLTVFVCGCSDNTESTVSDTDKNVTTGEASKDTGSPVGTSADSASDPSHTDAPTDTSAPEVTQPADTKPVETEPAETEPSDTTVPETTVPETTAPETTAPETEKEPEVVIPPSYTLQFDNPKSGIYNYCPSVMQTSVNTRYIYYCTNKKSYNVTDYIGCRKGTLGADGKWTWGAETLVLSPTAGTWDARHVCDPSVVMGEFKYNGETYSCLMAYLGCMTSNNQENDLGIAVAKSPEGPFIKVGNAPLVDYVRDMTVDQSFFQWGVGQPSVVNMDKKGSVTLFYTRGDHRATRTIVEEWDLSNLNAPTRKSSVKLSETGLKNLNNGGDILNNADFVYDPATRRFYSSSDCHPNPSGAPDFISSHFRVTWFTKPSNYSSFTWKNLAQIGPDETGFARNHNTGILRDSYGHLPNAGYVSVYYTVSITGNNSLWSYRIYDYHVKTP